jgi:hypothetical protein
MPRKKKIGTVQLAITLIVLGIAMVIDKISGTDWFGRILNLWPLLLIAIGAEIIWWQTRTRKHSDAPEWKIDGKSIVILTLVLVISGVVHMANTVVTGISKNGIWDFVNWSGVGPSHSVHLLEKELNLPGVESIRIVNSVGRLQVDGIDGNQIHLRAVARIHSGDASQAETRGKQIEIRVTEGKQAKIEVLDNGPATNRPSVDLVLQVPKRISIIGELNAGEADVSGVANADIDTNAGRVQVSNIPGKATIRTNAGSVEVREVGQAWVKTEMGRVTADNVKGKLDVSTNAGEVDVKTMYPAAADWYVKTDVGKISLAFPKESSVNIHATAEIGSIKGPSGNSNGPNAEYKYGDGQHQIVAKTNAGSISIDLD